MDRNLELVLGALKLGLSHRLVPELAELLDAQPYNVADLLGRGGRIIER